LQGKPASCSAQPPASLGALRGGGAAGEHAASGFEGLHREEAVLTREEVVFEAVRSDSSIEPTTYRSAASDPMSQGFMRITCLQ
jgi:hypothetical protein